MWDLLHPPTVNGISAKIGRLWRPLSIKTRRMSSTGVDERDEEFSLSEKMQPTRMSWLGDYRPSAAMRRNFTKFFADCKTSMPNVNVPKGTRSARYGFLAGLTLIGLLISLYTAYCTQVTSIFKAELELDDSDFPQKDYTDLLYKSRKVFYGNNVEKYSDSRSMARDYS